MKRLLIPVCIILIAIVVISGVGGKDGAKDVARPVSVEEAAFAMRTSKTEDATSFLVGRFAREDGEHLSFNGSGEVQRISANLVTETGECQLTQADDGSAILKMRFDGELTMYSFRLASPEGQFTLTDADGAVTTYTPYL